VLVTLFFSQVLGRARLGAGHLTYEVETIHNALCFPLGLVTIQA